MAVTTGRPGVFVSESLNPLTTTPVTPGQAMAAFVGEHSAGPVGPIRVTSWSDFSTRFEGFGDGTNLLPYSVYQFFAAGGSQAYIVRAVAADAVAASVTLNGVQTTPGPVLKLTSVAPGASGNDLRVTITSTAGGTPNNGRFNLLVRRGNDSTPLEQFLDVSLNPADGRNLISMVGAANTGSKFLAAEYMGAATWTNVETPAVQSGTPLAGGLDGTATPNLVDATQKLDSVQQILNINLPGISEPTVLNPLISWAQASASRFLVIDAPAAGDTPYADVVSTYSSLSPLGASGGTPLTSSSYAAVYGPWLHFRDVASATPGTTRLLPPGGSMLGLYSRADATYGTHQSAAGVAFPVAGALKAELTFTDTDLDSLNALGINIIRPVPGANGVVPMGARTLLAGMPDRYIAIRRTLMYLTRMAIESTNFAVFRANNEDLWDQLSSILTDQLSAIHQAGVLRGSTPQEAFFVKCDNENNPENQVANGIVTIDIGVALNTPAEYIIIQIGQMASGATSQETLAP